MTTIEREVERVEDNEEYGGGVNGKRREFSEEDDGGDGNDGIDNVDDDGDDEVLTSIEGEVRDTPEDGSGADDKGQEVGEGGDGDADSSTGQSLAQDVGYVLDRLLFCLAGKVLTPTGHHQEHVVHADP